MGLALGGLISFLDYYYFRRRVVTTWKRFTIELPLVYAVSIPIALALPPSFDEFWAGAALAIAISLVTYEIPESQLELLNMVNEFKDLSVRIIKIALVGVVWASPYPGLGSLAFFGFGVSVVLVLMAVSEISSEDDFVVHPFVVFFDNPSLAGGLLLCLVVAMGSLSQVIRTIATYWPQ